MVYDSARKAIASITKNVTKKATSKKKSKDVGTSKRRQKDDTSEEEEPDNPNDSAPFMVEEEINQGGVTMLISLMCLIRQSLGGSGSKRNLLLLGMQMLTINLMTHIICFSVPLCKSKLFSIV
jgi:hypothetical protein